MSPPYDDVPLYDLADFQALLAVAPGTKPAPKRLARNWEEAGGYDNYLTSLAGTMRARGMDPDAIRAALHAQNDSMEDPLEAERVDRIAGSIGKKPAGMEPGTVHYNLTDLGNAERFEAISAADLRWCTDRRKWYRWTGQQWKDDGETLADKRSHEIARALDDEVQAETDDDRRKALRAWASKSESRERLSAMVAVARARPKLQCKAADFDRNPWFLNVENGILNLQSGQLLDHDPRCMCSQMAAVRFVAGARNAILDKYLDNATSGDEAFRSFLQRSFGYSLTGDTGADAFFLVLGPGGTGKTTLVEGLKNLLGSYAVTLDAKALLRKKAESSHSSDLVSLRGARLVGISESEEDEEIASALVKKLTGGETIQARRIYEDIVNFKPVAKFWVATNYPPRAKDNDTGLWRRIVRVPFTKVLPEAERDPAIRTAIAEDPDVRAAILAWAVQGCLDWQSRGAGRNGLAIPSVVRNATAAYRDEQDPLREFLADCCQVGPGKVVEVTKLKQAYTTWARKSGETNPLKPVEFARRIEEAGIYKVIKKVDGVATRVWEGIELITGATNEPM